MFYNTHELGVEWSMVECRGSLDVGLVVGKAEKGRDLRLSLHAAIS